MGAVAPDLTDAHSAAGTDRSNPDLTGRTGFDAAADAAKTRDGDRPLGHVSGTAADHEAAALARYNHSPLYVDAVLRYARRIAQLASRPPPKLAPKPQPAVLSNASQRVHSDFNPKVVGSIPTRPISVARSRACSPTAAPS